MEQRNIENQTQLIVNILLSVVLLSFILYVGKTLFIPLSFSLLISFILFPFCRWFEQKGLNRSLAIAITILLLFLVMVGLTFLLFSQLLELSFAWNEIEQKAIDSVGSLSIFLAQKLGLSANNQAEILSNLANNIASKTFSILGDTLSSLSEGLVFLILVPIFSFLILLYRQKLATTLYLFFPKETQNSIYLILFETIDTYYNFIKGMSIIYLTVGILNSLGLTLIGIPHAILFGFAAAILTFIPYVGIMIGAIFPIMVAWATYNSIWYPFAVIVIFAIVQFLEAYLIFPLVVGKKLKINTLIIFIIIILGGMLWGAAGMILFIPMISIVKLIADKSPNLKGLSDFLGE